MHHQGPYVPSDKIRKLPALFAIVMIMGSCQANPGQTSLPDDPLAQLAALCGLQLDEACERLGCTADELEIAAERDDYTDYYLPGQTPPWDAGEEGSVEITFTVSREDGYIAGAWCQMLDSAHSLADEAAARAFYSLLETEDARLDTAFGPDGFIAFTNGEFERLDDQETFFERYPDVESFLDAYTQLPEEGMMNGRAEWLAEGETPVWLQFDWTANGQLSRFTWNYQTERFVAKRMGWEDYADSE